MTFPLQFGLPQVLLLVLVLFAVLLLLSSVVEMRPVAPMVSGSNGWRHRHRVVQSARRVRLRRPIRLGRGVGGVFTLVLALFLLWIVALIQTYLGLTGEVKAAHVVATPISNVPHTLSVELTLYDEKGRTESRQTYQVEGDNWVLQADIVELKHWVNVVGVHSGYKVSRLFGERLDGVSPAQHHIFINGGDGDFFQQMRDGNWWTKPFVRSAYGNAAIATPGEFDVYISQDAIKPRPAGR